MNEEKELTVREIVSWISKNCDDTEAMDKINKMTYPFTSAFKRKNDLA